MAKLKICPFAEESPQSRFYHDHSWCVPKTDERQLFEVLTLETFQAGLTWRLILKKKPAFERDFKAFDWLKVAHFSQKQIHKLFDDSKIIRNHRKIKATIHNAKILIQMHCHRQTLSKLTWLPVKYHPVTHRKHHNYALPTRHWVKMYLPRFKKMGFKFIGPKIIYSYLQGAGVINDHVFYCYRYPQIIRYDRHFAHLHRHDY